MNTTPILPVQVLLGFTLAFCDECLKREDYSAAWQALCRALNLAPTNTDTLNHRGRLALFLNDMDTAQRDFTEALKINPRCSPAFSGLARWYLRRSESTEAAAAADQALRIDPANEEAKTVKTELQTQRLRDAGLRSSIDKPSNSLLERDSAPAERDAHMTYQRFKMNGFREIEVSYPNRIGHLCLEIDSLLKDTIMEGKDTKQLFLRNLNEGFANPYLIDYFRDYLTVADDHPVLAFVRKHGDSYSLKLTTAHYAVAMVETASAYKTNVKWGDRPPLFHLKPEDQGELGKYLGEVGLNENDWYVAMHARGGGYSPSDERFHSYRNVDINSYGLAVEEIARRGGWCIRMGDSTMPPHPPHPRVIDYALSERKSPRLDVALAAACRFFLGSSSGVNSLATIFGRPCAITNGAPLGVVYSLRTCDLAIPQKLSNASGRVLSLVEIMSDDCANYRITEQFKNRLLDNIPNTAAEIRDLTQEMLDTLDGKAVYTNCDRERQTELRSFFRPGHYSFGATSNIGRDFLRQNMR